MTNPTPPGSSPPVRGALLNLVLKREESGLIPARAGSTLSSHILPGACWAHPRPCGEHPVNDTEATSGRGSSPPVRGAPAGLDLAFGVDGLIPARAGSTHSTCLAEPVKRAHPRPCGEHRGVSTRGGLIVGSSPPVRGALKETIQASRDAGLIPARAGSTQEASAAARRYRAHPRPCGEHLPRTPLRTCLPGSSPPVRGALLLIHHDLSARGLIPARAGSTTA